MGSEEREGVVNDVEEPAILQRYRDAESLADRTIDAARYRLYEGDFDGALEQLRSAEARVVEAARLHGQIWP